MKFADWPDLAARSLTGAVLAASDESFAEKECLVRDADPVFSPHTFGPRGQVYDGWETRRRRTPGHDWAIIRLGVPGVVHGVVVDTAFFKGNYPPEISVDGSSHDGYPSVDELREARWEPVVPRSPVNGDARNSFEAAESRRCTHVRLNIYPDGGVARLRVHGEPVPDPRTFGDLPIDLAALSNGGAVVDASNAFYSRPEGAIMPGRAQSQADGWETERRRGPGNDWMLLSLAGRGRVKVAELDTTHLKHNAPAAAALRGFDADSGADIDDPNAWRDLLPRTRLQPDTPHRFALAASEPVTHVWLDIFPDGGMARVRLFGVLTPDAHRLLLERFAELGGLQPPPHCVQPIDLGALPATRDSAPVDNLRNVENPKWS
ncbi:MAG: allantoicase [Stackebrandtia sp.]